MRKEGNVFLTEYFPAQPSPKWFQPALLSLSEVKYCCRKVFLGIYYISKGRLLLLRLVRAQIYIPDTQVDFFSYADFIAACSRPDFDGNKPIACHVEADRKACWELLRPVISKALIRVG